MDSNKQMSKVKTPGEYAIPPEIKMYGVKKLFKMLQRLFQVIWETGPVPQDYNDALVQNIYRNKGNRDDCENETHRQCDLTRIAA